MNLIPNVAICRCFLPGVLFSMLLFLLRCASAQPRVMAYYVGWEQDQMPPSEIDFTAITYLVHFAVIPNADGTLDPSPNQLTAAHVSAAVTAAHDAGRKILFTVGGENSANFPSAMSSIYQAAFISNLVGFMRTNNYDGIDLDMEPMDPTNETDFVNFAANLRAQLNTISPRPLLTTTALWTPATFGAAATNSSFDQINIMTYSLSGPYEGWFTWHNAPLYSSNYTFRGGGTPPSADTLVQEFVSNGVPKNLLGIGFSTDPFVWTDVGYPGQTFTSSTTATETNYYGIADAYGIIEYDNSSAYYKWDTNAYAPYLSITNQTPNLFISYDNEVSAQAKMNYVSTNGLKGLIFWNIQDGHRSNQPAGSQDLLLEAVKGAAFGSGSFAAATIFSDDFAAYSTNACFQDGTNFGPWLSVYEGYGCNQITAESNPFAVQLSPMAATNTNETHAGLVLGPVFNNPIDYSVNMKTVAQVRENDPPYAYERGWVLWDYQDNLHFYYLLLKTNGWELGKEDPAYPGAQRFMATGAPPTFSVGSWDSVRIVDVQNSITIYVDGEVLTNLTDNERPYTSGRIGLYTEEATVLFRNVLVNPPVLSIKSGGNNVLVSWAPTNAAQTLLTASNLNGPWVPITPLPPGNYTNAQIEGSFFFRIAQ